MFIASFCKSLRLRSYLFFLLVYQTVPSYKSSISNFHLFYSTTVHSCSVLVCLVTKSRFYPHWWFPKWFFFCVKNGSETSPNGSTSVVFCVEHMSTQCFWMLPNTTECHAVAEDPMQCASQPPFGIVMCVRALCRPPQPFQHVAVIGVSKMHPAAGLMTFKLRGHRFDVFFFQESTAFYFSFFFAICSCSLMFICSFLAMRIVQFFSFMCENHSQDEMRTKLLKMIREI